MDVEISGEDGLSRGTTGGKVDEDTQKRQMCCIKRGGDESTRGAEVRSLGDEGPKQKTPCEELMNPPDKNRRVEGRGRE